jgi:hypothetical protein
VPDALPARWGLGGALLMVDLFRAHPVLFVVAPALAYFLWMAWRFLVAELRYHRRERRRSRAHQGKVSCRVKGCKEPAAWASLQPVDRYYCAVHRPYGFNYVPMNPDRKASRR